MATWHSQVDPILDAEESERSAPANINLVSQNIIDAMNNSDENALGVAGKAPSILFLMDPFRQPTVRACKKHSNIRRPNPKKKLNVWA
ncbi:hypothetical protein DPV78_004383 [Talaromyces pinophilus]|nr:hypothetical protein DPV78_004383 [Talaromyces pinophilus]